MRFGRYADPLMRARTTLGCAARGAGVVGLVVRTAAGDAAEVDAAGGAVVGAATTSRVGLLTTVSTGAVRAGAGGAAAPVPRRRTSAARSATATGAGGAVVSDGPPNRRSRCTGTVNSKPHRRVSPPRESPWMVDVVPFETCNHSVGGVVGGG